MNILEIEIFTDETYIDDKYIGICSLFVPTDFKNELVRNLWNLRCLNKESNSWSHKFDKCNNSNCEKKYHDLNNFEIHFKTIENSTSKCKLEIYKRWIKFLVNHNKNSSDKNKLIYFKILFLDLDKLKLSLFGVHDPKKNKTNIYNFFYGSMIKGAMKFFFGKFNPTIKNFFHDNADDKKSHVYFPYNTPMKLKKKWNYTDTDEIRFIDSNHRNQEGVLKDNAQLIQFADLILGCSRYLLFNKKYNENKNQIASEFYPLFKRLWNNPKNKNSKFNYYRSQDISIFPKDEFKKQKNLDGQPINIDDQYHRDIKLKAPKSISKKRISG